MIVRDKAVHREIDSAKIRKRCVLLNLVSLASWLMELTGQVGAA
jgi:hypothetical protein